MTLRSNFNADITGMYCECLMTSQFSELTFLNTYAHDKDSPSQSVQLRDHPISRKKKTQQRLDQSKMVPAAYSEIRPLISQIQSHCELIYSILRGNILFKCMGPDSSPFPPKNKWEVMYKSDMNYRVSQPPCCLPCSLLLAMVSLALKEAEYVWRGEISHLLIISTSVVV